MKSKKDDHATWLDDIASKELQIQHDGIHVVDEPRQEIKKHWVRNRVTIFGLAGLFVLMFFWFFAGLYLSRVAIGDTTVSAFQSDEALAELVAKQAADYKLAIAYPDGSTKSFSLADMGFTAEPAETVRDVRRQQYDISQRLQWWKPVPAHVRVTSNDTKRNSFIATHATVTVQPATDATLSIVKGVVELKDSAPGTHNGLKYPTDTLYAAVGSLQDAPLKLESLATRPAITATQLAPHQTKLKNILSQTVTFTIGTKKYQAKPSDIADWVEISLNKTGNKIDININSGKVLAYINKIAAPYIEPPRARIEFSREDGSVTILDKGLEGTDIVDKSIIATRVAKDLLSEKSVAETMQVSHAELNSVSANGFAKWIEVDLTNKRMYMYEQSETVKTFWVSAGAPATPTVTGQYKIYSKVVQQDMRGLNADGSSYFQPNVSWINYFYKDYAIHGNYWRPLSWFGNINSSHGCVGLPDSQAEWVYSWAPVGTPVIVHK